MGRTVSNHSKTVVHTGSEHSAYTAKDVCTLPTQQPYDNVALSANLARGKSLRTTIQGNPIALENTHWTPSLSPGQVGIISGTTLDAAWVKTGSKDLFIEGIAAGRADDPTKQNKANSSGKVKPGTLTPRADGEIDRAKKKCQLKEWGGEGVGGAKLGYRGKDKTGNPDYLDVWDTDTISFWAKRHDITQKPPVENPKCEVPTQGGEYHTIWDASGKVFPLYSRKEVKHEHSKDTFVVPASLVIESFASGSVMKAMSEGDPESAMAALVGQSLSKFMSNDGDNRVEGQSGGLGRQDYGDSGIGGRGHTGEPKGWGKLGSYDGSQHRDAVDPRQRDQYSTPDNKAPRNAVERTIQGKPKDGAGRVERGLAKVGKHIDADPRMLLFYGWWWVNPPKIKVTATACSGSRQATIRVLPNQQIRFKVKLPFGEKFKQWAADQRQQRQDKLDQAERVQDTAQQRMASGRNAATQAQSAQQTAQQVQAEQAEIIRRETIIKKVVRGTTPRHQAARQRRIDAARKKWDEAGAEAFKQLANYKAAMAKFDNAAANFNKAVTAAQSIKKGLTVAQKIAKVAGQPLVFRFLEDMTIEVILEYLRTKEQESAMGWGYYTPATMGQKWTFKFSTFPLLSVKYTVYFSLLNLVTFYVPGLAQALRRFRVVRVDLYFSIEFKLSVNLQVIKDQHDSLSGATEAKANLTAEVGAIVGGAGVDVVQFSVTFPMELSAKFSAPTTKGALATMTPKARITNYYRAVLFPDRWYEIEAFSGTIDGLRYFWNQKGKTKYDVGSLPA